MAPQIDEAASFAGDAAPSTNADGFSVARSSLDEQPIALSVFAGARATTPAAVDALTWGAFCDEVEALCREETSATDKRDLVAFGPYRLRDGATRSAANVERMASVAALDLDSVDLDALRARLAGLGVSAIVHGSPSDDEHGTRKARVYVQLDSEHDPAYAGRVRAGVAAMLGVEPDKSTSNADRIFFCGRLAGTPPRFVERFNGRALELAELPPAPTHASTMTAPTHAAAPTPDVAATAAREQDTRARTAAAAAIRTAIGPAHEYDGRKHALCGALGGMLRKAGWTRDDCAALVRAWLEPIKDRGDVDVEKGVKWACGAWAKLPDECSGRAALDAVVGSSVGAIVEQAALLAWRAHRDSVGAPAIDECEPGTTRHDAGDDGDPFAASKLVSWIAAEPVIDYLCRGLRLAPSDGKVAAIFGQPAAGKGPLADHIAACFALNAPVLGRFEVARRLRVLLLDFEGATLTNKRVRRMARAMRREPHELQQWLYVYNQSAELNPIDPTYLARVRRFIEEHAIDVLVVDSYTSAMLNAGIDSNRPEYAQLAKGLASLNRLSIVVAHANKAAAESTTPRIKDLAYSGALGSLVGTGIAVAKPEPADSYLVRITCARAPETEFAPMQARFSDVDGGGLAVAVVDDAGVPTQTRREKRNAGTSYEAATERLDKAMLMLEYLRHESHGQHSQQDIMMESGAGRRSQRAVLDAWALLCKGKFITGSAKRWWITEKGRTASESDIRAAVGYTAQFGRNPSSVPFAAAAE